MNVLFVHNDFPGQFGAWAQHLANSRGHQVRAIGSRTAKEMTGVGLSRYGLTRGSSPTVHPFSIRFEADCLRGEAAGKAAGQLARAGFRPDVIVAHIGWGESFFLRDVWPDSKLIGYCEFFYHARGHDVNFDPEFESPTLEADMRVRAKNAGALLALADVTAGLAPTAWQRSTFPEHLRGRITVIHDGIDTSEARPRPGIVLKLPQTGAVLRPDDEVVTYVNRHLEPMRGLHIFLRSLPEILAARPKAEVLVIGAPSKQPYGGRSQDGKTWKERLLAEVADRIDASRVHWLGLVPGHVFLAALGISRVHVYLTYPFVLSWSVLQAMSSGCLVVASKTPPVQEVIEDGSNGLLVDFFDHRRLAELVISALSRPREHFAPLTTAARRTIVQRFDRSTVCVPRLVELVERVGS
jgi:glycosyltransferase involved in cell wall biosynthesis